MADCKTQSSEGALTVQRCACVRACVCACVSARPTALTPAGAPAILTCSLAPRYAGIFKGPWRNRLGCMLELCLVCEGTNRGRKDFFQAGSGGTGVIPVLKKSRQ